MAEGDRVGSDVPGEIGSWGGQTIAFAMSLRAMDVGKPLDDPKRLRAAYAEQHQIAQELWEQAYRECAERHDPVRIEHITMPFARQVLDWVADHLGSSTG